MTTKRDNLMAAVVFGGLGLFLLWIVFAVLGVGCRTAAPKWAGAAISCSGDAVRNNWSQVYPRVQTCLSSLEVNPILCLDAIPTAIRVTFEAVACVVRSAGSEAASQAQLNRDDTLSARQAERAKEWLDARKVTFQDAGP